MGLFFSTFHNKIDKKGRVSVPSSFREVLAQQNFKGIIAFRSLSFSAIEGFGADRMAKLSQDLDKMDIFSQDYEDWTASVFADAQQLAFDSEGRVLLPEFLCQHANLTDTAAFVGRGPTFQIWNPEDFKAYQDEARGRLRQRQERSLPNAGGTMHA